MQPVSSTAAQHGEAAACAQQYRRPRPAARLALRWCCCAGPLSGAVAHPRSCRAPGRPQRFSAPWASAPGAPTSWRLSARASMRRRRGGRVSRAGARLGCRRQLAAADTGLPPPAVSPSARRQRPHLAAVYDVDVLHHLVRHGPVLEGDETKAPGAHGCAVAHDHGCRGRGGRRGLSACAPVEGTDHRYRSRQIRQAPTF